MGITTFGIPGEIVMELSRLNNVSVFVETGTFHGGTTRWASEYFDSVFTIECAKSLYDLHNEELARCKGVKPLLGDSREMLPSVLREIGSQRAVFWLDGHWSGGETAGIDEECPVLEELACLSDRTDDIVLIDDARLFLCVPPEPHRPSDWPTIGEIVEVILGWKSRSYIQIIDDVIFVVPNKDSLKQCLVDYARKRARKGGKARWRLSFSKDKNRDRTRVGKNF